MQTDIKRNEATKNRPEGDRPLDAPYLFIDVPDFVRQLQQEKAWETSDRNGITIFKSDGITMVVTIVKAGGLIKDNQVDEYLTIHVLKGKARVLTTNGDIELSDHQMVTFHPFIVHSLEAVTDVIFLLSTYSYCPTNDTIVEKTETELDITD